MFNPDNRSINAPLAQPTAELPLAICVDAMDLAKIDPDRFFEGVSSITMICSRSIQRYGFIVFGDDTTSDFHIFDVDA